MTRALRAFRRSPLLLRLLSAALLGALLLHGSAPAVEAQALETGGHAPIGGWFADVVEALVPSSGCRS